MVAKLAARLPLIKKLAVILIALLVLIVLFLWLALPRIIQSQAEAFVAEKTGHRLNMERPQFNPFNLSLQLGKLQLTDPDGKPLAAFAGLLVDISAASLPQRALVFDAIRLDAPEVTLIELPGGVLNWSPFLAALKSKEEKPATGLPRLDIRSFVLAGGVIDFADRRREPGFTTRVEPLDLSLTDLSTLPDDSGKFKIEARTSIGAQIALAGEVDLNPMIVAGTLSLQGLQLDQLAPFVKDMLPAAPIGAVNVSASYRAGNSGATLSATVDRIEAGISGLHVPIGMAQGAGVSIDAIALKGGSYDLGQQLLTVGAIDISNTKLELPRIERSLDMASIALQDARIDLAARQASVASLTLSDGNLYSARGTDGRIYLLDALAALAETPKVPKASKAEPAGTATSPWRFKLGKFAVTNLNNYNRDESVSPPAELALEKIAIEVRDITENLRTALPVKIAFDIRSGGRFEAEGHYTVAGPVADFRIKLADLALKPAQPYLASRVLADILDGRLSSQGQVVLDDKGPRYRGDFSLRDLRINEAGTGNSLLAWKNFSTKALSATDKRLDIVDLHLNGLDSKLIIDKDRTVNFQKVLKKAPGSAQTVAPVASEPTATPAAAPATAESAPKPASATPPAFVVNVDRLRFYNGELYFADHSLVLPFGTRIHKLRGNFNHLSSQPGGAHGQLELEGEVDEYGLARAVGQVDLFDPTGFMDIRVLFRNVEMTRLTPYMATFAGRKIDSGKLSLDLQYKLKQRQMEGENQVMIDRLVLGERVESATAKDLPLDLAIAILQDSDGRIDLGLPVSGNLDDPQFSYGAIVWKAITNVLTKIVTAPFRALASLFGGSEKIENVSFEAGMAQLTPPEREKLVRLAEGMAKRPGLVLGVGGIYAENDRVALQDLQLRRTIMNRMGQRVSEDWDPGSVSTSQPAVRETLEKLYAERIGASDLAALKEGFRKANPGQLEENLAGKMMSRLSGLLREKKTLSEEEVGQLKGTDYYTLLYERVRAKENVGDDRLQTLGQARGELAMATLKSAGMAAERIQALPPEKGEGGPSGIPLKLALEASKKD